eukprot:PhM_4_TR16744/c1_g1_i13/m.79413
MSPTDVLGRTSVRAGRRMARHTPQIARQWIGAVALRRDPANVHRVRAQVFAQPPKHLVARRSLRMTLHKCADTCLVVTIDDNGPRRLCKGNYHSFQLRLVNGGAVVDPRACRQLPTSFRDPRELGVGRVGPPFLGRRTSTQIPQSDPCARHLGHKRSQLRARLVRDVGRCVPSRLVTHDALRSLTDCLQSAMVGAEWPTQNGVVAPHQRTEHTKKLARRRHCHNVDIEEVLPEGWGNCREMLPYVAVRDVEGQTHGLHGGTGNGIHGLHVHVDRAACPAEMLQLTRHFLRARGTEQEVVDPWHGDATCLSRDILAHMPRCTLCHERGELQAHGHNVPAEVAELPPHITHPRDKHSAQGLMHRELVEVGLRIQLVQHSAAQQLAEDIVYRGQPHIPRSRQQRVQRAAITDEPRRFAPSLLHLEQWHRDTEVSDGAR